MKKLLITGILGTVLGTSVFAGEIAGKIILGKISETLSIQVKSVDISDSGLDRSIVYGINYSVDKDFGQPGAWRMRYSFEFNYGKMDYSDKSGDTTYTESGFLAGPSYIFNCGAEVYLQAKAGCVGFSDPVTNNNKTDGYVLAGVAGVEYPIKSFIIGAKAEVGNTYIDSEAYSTTTFGGYVRYRF